MIRFAKTIKENNITKTHPDVAAMWHPTENDGWLPEHFTAGSGFKAVFLCPKGVLSEHKWTTAVSSLALLGTRCPFCCGKRLGLDNCLANRFPEISKEWHPALNGDKTPFDFTSGSSFHAAWCCDKRHVWRTAIRNRTSPESETGCPFCDGQRVTPENCLLTKVPKIIEFWDYERNEGKKPEDFATTSKCEVKFRCNKGVLSEHVWEETIWARIRAMKTSMDCPFCAGRRLCLDSCLATKCPDIARDWDYEKNIITPSDVIARSTDIAHWKCYFCSHRWSTSITARVWKERGCPRCHRSTSRPELFFFTQFLYIFPDAVSGEKVNKISIDIFSDKHKIAIEIDGYPWHLGRESNDRKKTKSLEDIGIKTFRIRDEKMGRLESYDILTSFAAKIIDPLFDASKKLMSEIKNGA